MQQGDEMTWRSDGSETNGGFDICATAYTPFEATCTWIPGDGSGGTEEILLGNFYSHDACERAVREELLRRRQLVHEAALALPRGAEDRDEVDG